MTEWFTHFTYDMYFKIHHVYDKIKCCKIYFNKKEKIEIKKDRENFL